MPAALPLHRLDIAPPDPMRFAIGTFDSIGPLSRAAFPHRHTFYEVVFVTSGSGSHVVDLTVHPLRPPHLSCVAPGQVHFWERAGGLDGTVILFEPAFLDAHPADSDLLHALSERPLTSLSKVEKSWFAPIIGQMSREYRHRAGASTAVLQSLLHILLLRAQRLQAPPAAPRPAGRTATLAQQFARMLARPDGHRRTVGECAARLGVSPSYLNEAVKTVTGRTPAGFLRQAQVMEAKRLLARTDLSVAQVAAGLGFADPAYFCRFFRRESGQTPGQFRRAAGENHHHHPTLSIDPAHWPS